MSGSLFADAVATAEHIGWALFAWLFVAAFIATFVTLALLGAVWALPSAAWRASVGALAASRALRALREVHAPQNATQARTARPAPSWAHTDKEAAA